MKTILRTVKIFIAFVIVFVAVPPIVNHAAYTPWTDKNNIRVALNWDGNTTYSDQKITCYGADIYNENGEIKHTTNDEALHTIIAKKNDLGFYITVDGKDIGLAAVTATSASQIRLILIKPRKANSLITYGSYSYHGDIFFRRYSSGRIYTTNVVTLKDYTRGVVGAEIGSNGAYLEAIKAQAICAASYAKHHKRHEAAALADVCNTTNCQVYRGSYYDNTTNIVTAVNAVGGKLMYYIGSNASYKGKVVEALFFANTGSTRTIDNIDYGGTVDIPYLNSVDSTVETSADLSAHSGNANWTFTMDQTFAKTKFGIGEITSITPTFKNGSVNKVVLTGKDGTKTYTKDQCRSFANSSTEQKIKSPHWTVEKIAASSGAVSINKDSKTSSLPNTVYIESKDGKTSKSINDLYIIDKNNKITKAPAASYKFVFTGKGWGHFVGMSQVGAISMAKAGKTYMDILKKYYGSDIEVK